MSHHIAYDSMAWCPTCQTMVPAMLGNTWGGQEMLMLWCEHGIYYLAEKKLPPGRIVGRAQGVIAREWNGESDTWHWGNPDGPMRDPKQEFGITPDWLKTMAEHAPRGAGKE